MNTIDQPSRGLEKEQTLLKLFHRCDSFAENVAIVAYNSNGSQQLTFQELLSRIKGLAQSLAQAGLKRQEAVMLFAANSPELIVAGLSVMYAGGVCLPVDVQASDEVLSHIIQDSNCQRAFADAKGAERLQRLSDNHKIKVTRLDSEEFADSWSKSVAKTPENDREIAPDDQAALFYTSGTTGLPKGVPLTHANLLLQLEAVVKIKLVQSSDRVLLPLPLFHVYPFVCGCLTPLYLGIPLILPKSITGPEILRAIKEGEATILIAVPRLLRALYSGIESKARDNNITSTAFDLAFSLSQATYRFFNLNIGRLVFQSIHKRLPTLRLFACGGALLDPELAQNLMALGWRIAVGYGLTETSPLLTVRMPGNRDLSSVGKAIPGVEIRLAKIEDNDGEQEGDKQKDDSEQEQKEIQARGATIFHGYRNLPEKTAEAFSKDGWFRTGDIGVFEQDNLHIVGRISTMIKSEGGKKIQPDEVEQHYTGEAVIREIGVLQSKQKLVALVVPNLKVVGHDNLSEKVSEAINAISKTLPSYYRVTDFAISNEPLPRTNIGKIRRKALSERYEQIKAVGKDEQSQHKGHTAIDAMSPEDRALLEDPVVKQCWDWLCEKFPDAELTLDKSPQVDLNVDSLEWVNLTLEIQEKFGVELSEEAIARVDTVRDLLNEVHAAAQSGGNSVSPFQHPEQFLDDSQKRWLKPLGPFMLATAFMLYWTNWFLMRLLFRVSAENLKQVPNEQIVITPSHQSYIDPFVLAAVLDFRTLHRTQWAGWAGIFLANPFTAFVYRLAQAIPIEASRSPVSSLALAAAVIKSGRNLIWFPEGARTETEELLPFKAGVGMLLNNFEIKVVPTLIEGARQALPPGAFWPHLNKITIIFGQPVSAKELLQTSEKGSEAERIAGALRDRVQDMRAKFRGTNK
jgi:long-chain acyl-CoA synthetase